MLPVFELRREGVVMRSPESSASSRWPSRFALWIGVAFACGVFAAAVSDAAESRQTGAQKIVFVRLLSPGEGQLWTMNTNGSNQQPLTPASESVATPAWSPDGQEIAFTSTGPSGDPSKSTIWLIKADGSGEHQLTQLPPNCQAIDDSPTWSPDGTRIAFISDRSGPWELYTIKTDGSGLQKITSLPFGQPCEASGVGASSPSWLPKANTIVFADDYVPGHDLGHHEIYLIHPDGSGLRRLTNRAAAKHGCQHGDGNSQPTWSPNGRNIAFTSDLSGHPEIYVMNTNGNHSKRLTHLKRRGCPNGSGNQLPTWSPDTKHIAFTTDRTGRNEIYAMNSDGSNQHALTNGPTTNYSPAWQPTP